MKTDELIAGLDIGSGKFCLSVGCHGDNGRPEILKTAIVKSQGMGNGVVIDLKGAAIGIEEAVRKIRLDDEYSLGSVYVNISGEHILGAKARNFLSLAQEPREVTPKDIAALLNATRVLNTPVDREAVHTITHSFWVDTKSGIKNPIGMYAARLTVDLYLLTALSAELKNLTRTVNRAGLDVKGVVVSSLASSQAVLTEYEKENGVILLEAGAGTIQMLLYHDDCVEALDIIPHGGNEITAAIAQEFKIEYEQAEKIKIAYSAVDPALVNEEEKIILQRDGLYETINRRQLASVIAAKTQEIISCLDRRLEEHQYKSMAKCGIVVSGGMAAMEGFLEALQKGTSLSTRLGMVRGFNSMLRLNSPWYATSVGLVMYGLNGQKEDENSVSLWRGRGGDSFIVRKLRELYEEYF